MIASTEDVTSSAAEGVRVPTKTELVEAGLLKERQAEALVLRDVEGHDREEAAELMGVDPTTVDTHLHRARKRLDQARETLELLEEGSA